ncbi:hypothetical protein [Streptomyces eurythermus]|uniref:hypothetical protein n=1 Tax=Streptomyces eurythermus TaxID=42237 RepID=UPI0036D24FCC
MSTESVAPVVVVDRRAAGSADASGLTQTLAFSVVVGRQSHDLVQSQAYLAMLDVDDPHRRVVVRLVLTSTASQRSVLLDDFRDLVRTVRPGGGHDALAGSGEPAGLRRRARPP